MRQIPRLLAVGAVVATAVACSDSFQPSVSNVSGIYQAQSFTTTDNAGTHDWIVAGASLELLLTPQGTSSGQLVVPDTTASGGFLIALLIGSWTLTGDIIKFDQAVDTFVRDLAWIATKDRLTADQTLGTGTRIKVVLTRQPL